MARSRFDPTAGAKAWNALPPEHRIRATLDAMIEQLAERRDELIGLRRDWLAYQKKMEAAKGTAVPRKRRATPLRLASSDAKQGCTQAEQEK